MAKREVVLCNPVRTPIGTYGGALKNTSAPALGAVVIREVLKRSDLAAEKVQTLVMGQVIQAGAKMNPARQAGIGGGLPVGVPALTVNRVCGSGAQGIVSAALEIMAGQIDCAIAGGMENMDMAPYLLPQGRWGARMGDVALLDSMLLDGLNDAFSGQHSGWHTEDLVAKHGIGRADQDAWALRSQQAFSAAQAAGKFEAEIVPVEVKGRKGPELFAKDEHNRPDTTAESLAKLSPPSQGRLITAATRRASRGAAAMIVAERQRAEANGCSPSPGGPYGWPPSSRVSSASARSRPCARPCRAPAGRSPASTAWRSTRPSPPSPSPARASWASPRTWSTSRAAPSPTATRSAPAAPC